MNIKTAMFEAVVSQFTEWVGAESNLIPVPDLDSARDYELLRVVIKKNKKWFWQSPRYEPASDIFLHELLTDTKPFTSVKQEINKLVTYNKKQKFSIKGKVGAKLNLEPVDAGIEAQGLEFMGVEAKFGDIVKVEADQYDLMKALENRKVDLKNEFLRQVRQNKRKVLCVVMGIARLTKEGTVNAGRVLTGEENVDGGNPIASASESLSAANKSLNCTKIPAGTPLAHNVLELLVHSDGSLQLIIEKDCEGGFEDACGGTTTGLSPVYRDIQWPYIRDALRGLDIVTRRKLTCCTLTMCTYPPDVSMTLHLLKNACRLANDTKCVPVKQMQIDTSLIRTLDYQSVLEPAGFIFTEGVFSYPEQRTPKLEAIRYLFLALKELDEDTLRALGHLDGEYVIPMRKLLCRTINGKHYCTTDVEVHTIFVGDNSGRHLADSLGFTVETDTQQITIPASDKTMCRLNAACRVLFALWNEMKDIKSEEFTGGCILL